MKLAFLESRLLITSLTILCIILRATVTLAEISCYYPDGYTIAPLHIPCNSSAVGTPKSATACCRDYPNAYCVSNGLCYDEGVLSRGSCTDKTWKSPSCAQECTRERRNASVGIFNCKGQGTYQCGWGDCLTNFTDQNPFTIILRDDQKSASISLPSKGSNTLAVGLGIGLSLGICLLVLLWLLYRQYRRLKMVELATCRKSIEKPSGDWQWPHGSWPHPVPQGDSPPPSQPAYNSPIRQEAPPTALGANRGPPRPPKIPNQRSLQELRDETAESHELDSYNCDSNGTREFV